jgi:mannan endo-1,4-beta-mannosidase
LADTQRLGRHRQSPQDKARALARQRRTSLIVIISAAGMAVIVAAVFVVHSIVQPTLNAPTSSHRSQYTLPAAPDSYIGVYMHGIPQSYADARAFSTATHVKPDVILYYSGWEEAFQTKFAATAADNGQVPLVQINPTGINISAISDGQYDGYLKKYAMAVRAYHHPVILSFGHEMNGYWYSWGHTHTSPATFVAAWRHIVNLFRSLEVRNVTWLWTINTIHAETRVPSPNPWWPGSSYVTWVGIDGYYVSSADVFSSVFGPTIAAVRTLTRKPILVAETASSPAAGQPAKIADLFAGLRLYGLLGFVWFNSSGVVDWRLNGPAALQAFRRGAEAYRKAAPGTIGQN